MTNRKAPKRGLEVSTRSPSGFDVDSDEWREARARVGDLKELTKDGPVSNIHVAALSTQWGVSRATVWRRIDRYRRTGNLTGLLPGRTGRKPGVTTLDAATDDMIRRAARAWWRRTENATIAEIEPTVVQECIAAGLQPPSRATIARRLVLLRGDPDNFTGEVRQTLRERRRLIRSSYSVEAPLNATDRGFPVHFRRRAST